MFEPPAGTRGHQKFTTEIIIQFPIDHAGKTVASMRDALGIRQLTQFTIHPLEVALNVDSLPVSRGLGGVVNRPHSKTVSAV